jgi:small subunit ribosomal protein S24e
MEVQIIKDKANPILNRRDVSLKVKDKVTPSRIEVKNKLAALLNSKPELIVIEHLNTVYGRQEMIGEACIYETEERLKQLAHKHLVARDAPKAKEGAGEAAAAAPTQAAQPATPAAKEPEVKAEAKTEAKSEAKPEAKPKVEAKSEEKKKSEKK